MAASAIIALQNQAKTPIKELQNKFFSAIKEVGDIWAQFYKTYFSTARRVSIEDEQGKPEPMDFLGTKYAGIDFKTKTDVGVSSERESLVMTVLEGLKASKDIDKFQYIELAPDSAVPFRNQLKKMWEKEATKDKQLIQCMQMIKQYQELLAKAGINVGGMPNEMQTMPA
jgi:hypothetical protein